MWKHTVAIDSTLTLALAVMLLCAGAVVARQPDPLLSGFEHPPASARPRVWWHWVDGNITKEGIELDLRWMQRVGIGGFQNFDAGFQNPVVVEKPMSFMGPEWKDAFRFSMRLADQLGLETAIAGSPGWSETGGPWVKPAQAMKKVVWTATRVSGGQRFTGVLARPPGIAGPFSNLPATAGLSGAEPKPVDPYYVDSFVIAFPAPSADVPVMQLHPKITSSRGDIDAAMLVDGDLVQATALPKTPGQPSWIQYEFAEPQAMQAVSLAMAPTRGFGGAPAPGAPMLMASDDGVRFRDVARIEALTLGFSPHGTPNQVTVAFPPVAARYFRIVWPGVEAVAQPIFPGAPTAPADSSLRIAELVLHAGARVNQFEVKAGFAATPDLYASATPTAARNSAIAKSRVINLTAKMRADGSLDWTSPAGEWVVLRFGYSLTGSGNAPARTEAAGLEVDKLNHKHVKAYLDAYLAMYRDATGAGLIGRHGLRNVITDSWEAANQNWTEDMAGQFRRRRGYDLLPWLPVLAGWQVESAEASDGFLWDFRKTIADLIADEHYGQIEASLKQAGLGHYSESQEDHRAFVADGMEVKKRATVPMGAMWVDVATSSRQIGYDADLRESASVAHLYGQNIVAGESLTTAAAPWSWHPALLKPTADRELAQGLNRFVIHTSAHQPLIGKAPGTSLGPFGQWFNRNDTWAEQAGAWVDYLSRSSYLLQQGRFAADILYFYGEDSNITAIFADHPPAIPQGYAYDYVNADAVQHLLAVRGGRIVARSGMSYRLLALDPYSRHMSLPVLRKLRDLVMRGAIVAGARPVGTPSLADDAREYSAIARQLFGDAPGERHVGKGTVFSGADIAESVVALRLQPDFSYSKSQPDSELLFVHRTLPDGEIYWIDNRSGHSETVDGSFRVAGRRPEFWRAETGRSEPAGYALSGDRTSVPLQLEPWGTVFVVFRTAPSSEPRVRHKIQTTVATLDGPWRVEFQPGRGAPESISLASLASWSDSVDPGVKYYSGTGTYTRRIDAEAKWFSTGAALMIDLGEVKNLAEVIVNGKSMGIVWHAPFRIDATEALRPGTNEIVIKVTDSWVNRMIGDQQPGAVSVTYSDLKPYRADTPLQPSGLLGPVTVVQQTSD